MDDKQELDVESIVQHIRENLRKRRTASTASMPEPSPEDQQTNTDLADLHSNHDIYRIQLTSHRRVVGWLVVLAKKLIRQLLTPSLERQVAYNAANMRISSRLWESLRETRMQVQETREQQRVLQSKIEALAYQQDQLRGEIEATLQGKIEALTYQQGQLRGEIEAVGQRQESALQALQTVVIARTDEWGQQQMGSLQALQEAIMEQIQVVGQRLADRDRRLAELERAVAEVKSSVDTQEQQLSLLLK